MKLSHEEPNFERENLRWIASGVRGAVFALDAIAGSFYPTTWNRVRLILEEAARGIREIAKELEAS